MSDLSSYNLVVIGAGIGGYPAAIRAAQLGASVLIVDKGETGGTCLNRGCIPTKAFKATSDILVRTHNLDEFGLSGEVNVKADIKTIVQRKNRIVSELVKGVEFLFKSHGVTLKKASAAFLSKNRLQLTYSDGTREVVESKRFIIGTGSSPADLPGLRADGKFILDSTDILNIDTLPKRLIIIGAGVIGTEFAFIFKSLGVDIVMLEIMPRALPTEDEDIASLITRSLKKSGITLRTGTRVTQAEIRGEEVNLYLDNGEVVTGDRVLLSVGRTINTDGLGLENTGVKLGKRKEIVVDKFLSTAVDGIYACGDAIGGKMLAHIAYREGITAASNLLEGKKLTINYDAIPSALYSTPEAASVGLTEKSAREKGLDIKIGRFPYRALGKARAFSQTEGEVKVIVEQGTDKVLGMHIAGAHATDIIAQGAIAIQNGLTIQSIINTVAAHPTYSEAVMEAGEDIFSRAIHQPKKPR
ncbi:MAG: dihydrolipoyl dehydrogenase [Deltaproteobacteria bacterium]|nr:dihydrolipoyl dehydrogenase [Deltaproteobacteria bacterium]